MKGGSRTMGFCDDTGVYFAEDMPAASQVAAQTALEEVAHYVTGATDVAGTFRTS